MAKTVAKRKSFNFTGGLNTESGPLNSTENQWVDGINVVPYVDGSVNKRAAVDFEGSYTLSDTNVTAADEVTGAFVTYEWDAVAGSGALNFVAAQRGSEIFFYKNLGDGVSPTEFVGQGINLADYRVVGNPNTPGMAPCSFTNANGKLLVTSEDTETLLVTYDIDTTTFTVETIEIKIRDLYGLDDTLATEERPATLSPEHNYNLLNQGWDATKIAAYFSSQSVYPSNAQQWTAGKDSSDDFSPTLLVKQDFGTSPAAKGRYILSLFNQDRSAASGLAAGLVETEYYRPSSVAFYAGRAWYAGINSRKYASWVMFSQVAADTPKFGLCYQEADPTSEFISDLVDTDGGVVPIQDMGSVVALRAAYNSIIVFADNGVWQIQGGTDIGFAASSYDVRKLTSAGCLSPTSIIDVEQSLLYWSNDGIWQIAITQTGGLAATNITSTNIQTLYTSIPMPGRVFSTGRYHLEVKCAYWAYNDDASQDSVTRRYQKNKLLVLDVRLKAFYVLEISSLASDSPYITDLIVTKPKAGTPTTYDVVDEDGNPVSTGLREFLTFDTVQTDIGGTADSTQLYVHPDGNEIYSIGNGSDTVSIHTFDTFTDAPDTVAIGQDGAISDDRNGCLSSDGSVLWVSGDGTNYPSTDKPIRAMVTATRVMTNMGYANASWYNYVMAADATHVYIAGSDRLAKYAFDIDTASLGSALWTTVGGVDFVSAQKAAVFDGDGNIWVAQATLSLYNTTTGARSSHTPPSSLLAACSPAYDFAAGRLYVILTSTIGANVPAYLYSYSGWDATDDSGTWELIETYPAPGAQ